MQKRKPGNYLTDRSIRVVLSGQLSSTSSIDASVPGVSAGTILLLSVFIDDLCDGCEDSLCLCADGSALFCGIASAGGLQAVAAGLNGDLTRMMIWADQWEVTYEPSICKALTISRKRQHQAG